jgi:hypothetical protein
MKVLGVLESKWDPIRKDRLPWSAWMDSLGELPRNAWIASLTSRGCVLGRVDVLRFL